MIDPRSQSKTTIQSGKHTTIHLLLSYTEVKGKRTKINCGSDTCRYSGKEHVYTGILAAVRFQENKRFDPYLMVTAGMRDKSLTNPYKEMFDHESVHSQDDSYHYRKRPVPGIAYVPCLSLKCM